MYVPFLSFLHVKKTRRKDKGENQDFYRDYYLHIDTFILLFDKNV